MIGCNASDENMIAEPTTDDVAAIMAVLESERTVTQFPPVQASPWRTAALREGIEKWTQPHRLSRITWEN